MAMVLLTLGGLLPSYCRHGAGSFPFLRPGRRKSTHRPWPAGPGCGKLFSYLPRGDRHPPPLRTHPPARPPGAPMRSLCRLLRLALHALRRNPLRSALTTLGIVIGVAAVIAMVEIGQGSAA